jgi:hypothetical protein
VVLTEETIVDKPIHSGGAGGTTLASALGIALLTGTVAT